MMSAMLGNAADDQAEGNTVQPCRKLRDQIGLMLRRIDSRPQHEGRNQGCEDSDGEREENICLCRYPASLFTSPAVWTTDSIPEYARIQLEMPMIRNPNPPERPRRQIVGCRCP